ncbi:unnamed protein product, partial [Polarella glacialis]
VAVCAFRSWAKNKALLAVDSQRGAVPILGASGLAKLIRMREQSVTKSLSLWEAQGLLSAPPGSQSRKRKRRAEAFGRSAVPRCLPSVRLEIQESVPGFAVARGFLGALFRQKLERIVDNSLLPPTESVARRSAPSGQRPAADQAMRFGADMPGWANRLGLRCSKLPGLLSAEVKSRQPLFDQLIANAYQAGQGIGRHVDLLKFDDGILGVCR